MATRTADERETGPRTLSGLTDAGTSGELPAIDTTVGAAQRMRVHVPTEDTTLSMGKRVAVTRVEDSTAQLGFDGFNGITNAHVFVSSGSTGTLQAAGRVYVVSFTSSLSAVGKGELLIGSEKAETTIAAKKAVVLVSGYGPGPTTVTEYGETPENPSHAHLDDVADAHTTAALVASGAATVIGIALTTLGVPRASWATSIAAYAVGAAGLLTGFKSIVEGASGKSIESAFSDSSSVNIHAKNGVVMTVGWQLSGISMYAPAGAINLVGGLTAGFASGVATGLSSLVSSSVSGLANAAVSAVNKAGVTGLMYASLESRLGASTIRGVSVDVGAAKPPKPQAPTIAAKVSALMKVTAKAGLSSVELNAATLAATMTALKSITLEVLPYTIEVSPLGVKIAMAGVPAVEITAGKISVASLPQSITITPAALTLSAAPSSIAMTPAAVTVTGLAVDLGPGF